MGQLANTGKVAMREKEDDLEAQKDQTLSQDNLGSAPQLP
jgi:hypothetical protein